MAINANPVRGTRDFLPKEMRLREAMQSPLFRSPRTEEFLADDHAGGCVLYEKRAEVEKLLTQKSA